MKIRLRYVIAIGELSQIFSRSVIKLGDLMHKFHVSNVEVAIKLQVYAKSKLIEELKK